MPNIDALHTSITSMSTQDLYALVRRIREIRRTRPAPKRKAPARTKRNPFKRSPKAQDLFILAENMSPADKAKLLLKLTGGTP